MGFLDINLDDVKEPTVVPANSEVQIRVVSAETGTDKNNHPYLLVRFDVPDTIGAKDFTYFLSLPHGDLDEKKLNNVKWRLKVFFDAVGVDPNTLESPDELVGLTCWAILGVSEDEQYGEQNYVKKFVKGA